MCKTILNRFTLIVGIFICTMTIISCQKNLVTDVTTDQKLTVSFSIAGVNNSNKGKSKLGSVAINPMDKAGAKENSIVNLNSAVPNVSLDITNEITDIGFSLETIQPKVLDKLASQTPMEEGRKFRIVILDLNNNIVNTVQSSVDKAVNIDLEAGVQYNWYAYSYNSDQDIPAPTGEQIIDTPTDSDLLYAKSTTPFTVGGGEVVISILFEHQVAMLSIELDYSKLYATIPTNHPDSTSVTNNLKWEFVAQPSFLYKGTFSLTTGAVSNPVLYTANLNQRIKNHPSKENTKVADCYFVPPPPETTVSNNFTVLLNTLNVNFANSSDNVAVISSAVSSPFSGVSNTKGDKYVAEMLLRYKIPKKLILHVTATDSDDDHKMALAAQPYERDLSKAWSAAPENNRPPFNMIKAARNYGDLNNSIVYTDGFDHMRCSVDGTLDQKLTIPGQIPDIVILSVHYAMDTNDITALINYLNNGGVVIMFTAYNGHNEDRVGVTNFMRTLFSNNSINLVNNVYGNASLFEIDHENKIDDMITNGPFGDLRGKYWGVDYYNVIQMTGIPSNMVTAYSNPSAINRSNVTTALSMFKHKTLDFFWIGNGGFLSGPNWNLIGGYNTEWDKEPFATVLLPNSTHPDSSSPFNYDFYPLPKKFGRDYNHPVLGRIGYSYGSQIYNAPFFANLMSWALYRSEFFGVNRNN